MARIGFSRRNIPASLLEKGAPTVSGGEVGAKADSLTIMVGGSEATFAKVKPHSALVRSLEILANHEIGQSP